MGQVELDAVKPNELQAMCEEAILSHFDEVAYGQLLEEEAEESEEYNASLIDFVVTKYS